MKNSTHYTRPFIRCALAAAFLIPALGWAHGAVDIPIARQVKCKVVGGYWASENGSTIADAGCRNAAMAFSTPAERAYQMDQWNEVAKLIREPGYYDDAKVKAAVPDGQLCAAGDPKKRGLDAVSPSWYKTSVTPINGKIKLRLIGTAPHVPSFMKVYLTKPEYTGTAALKWSDLSLVHEEQFNVARKDWTSPPAIAGVVGFFEVNVPIPNGQTGNAVLYTRWQRIDPAGEGFYNCSDITIEGQSHPFPWHEKGAFISTDMTPKIDDTMQFRVMGHEASAREVVDIKVPITAANMAPAVWGKQLADQLGSFAHIIKVGIRAGDNVAFDPNKVYENLTYLANEKDSTAMSIISGGGSGGGTSPVPAPSAPEAKITGPTSVKAGETFTLSAQSSIGHPGPLRFHWAGNIPPFSTDNPTFTLTAPMLAGTEPYYVGLTAFDDGIKQSSAVKVNITVDYAPKPSFPAYVPGTVYKAGQGVSNVGKSFTCKPHPYTGWCSGSPLYYAPGTGLAWKEAWDEVNP